MGSQHWWSLTFLVALHNLKLFVLCQFPLVFVENIFFFFFFLLIAWILFCLISVGIFVYQFYRYGTVTSLNSLSNVYGHQVHASML